MGRGYAKHARRDFAKRFGITVRRLAPGRAEGLTTRTSFDVSRRGVLSRNSDASGLCRYHPTAMLKRADNATRDANQISVAAELRRLLPQEGDRLAGNESAGLVGDFDDNWLRLGRRF